MDENKWISQFFSPKTAVIYFTLLTGLLGPTSCWDVIPNPKIQNIQTQQNQIQIPKHPNQ